MPFDPSKPANNTPLNSAELRSQLTSLKTLVDACPTTTAMQNHVLNHSSGSVATVSPVTLLLSDPPATDEVQVLINKLNELIAALKREPPS